MSRRLLVVHAHPDDESSKGAATAARYVDEGAEVVLVTCTDGAAGEVLNPALDATSIDDLARVRRSELAAAVGAIGFTRVHDLGFPDSGYHLEPADVPEGTFARTPVDVAAAALADIVRRERPQVVVTYGEDGGYPHPDHVMVHLVTMRALELAADPGVGAPGGTWRVAKVYATLGFPDERLTALHDAMVERGLDSPFTEWLAEPRPTPATTPDARIDCRDHLARRDAALVAHATQIDPDGPWFAVPRDLERAVYPFEAFALIASEVWTRVPEDDLFAGIDIDAWEVLGAGDVPPGS